jgi:hypothetical protein
MGWLIIKHSFGLVFRNFGNALKVSVGPIIIASAILYGTVLLTGFTPAWAATSIMLGRLPGTLIAVAAVGVIVYLFVATWIAVAWHKFILIEEYPGFLPPLSVSTVTAYIGKSFVIGLLLLLALVPMLFVAGLALGLLGLTQNAMASLVIGFVLGLLLTYLWLRLAMVLPGVAIGNSMTNREAWTATAPMSDDIFGASAILVAVNSAISFAADFVLPTGIVYYLVILAINWFTMMVGISLLTTLYGHLIEKRPLV